MILLKQIEPFKRESKKMKKPTVYECAQYLQGYDSLIGKKAHLEILETPRSRKWKHSGMMVKSFSEYAYQTSLNLINQNGYHSIRWVED